MEWTSVIALFIGIVCVVEGILFMVRRQLDPGEKIIRKRLKELTATTHQLVKIDITRKQRLLSHIPQLHSILSKMPLLRSYDKLILQADSTQPLGFFLLLSPLLFAGGFTVTSFFVVGYLIPFLIGMAAGWSPFFYLLKKKRVRTNKFEQQLPDALDLMARSLRAGHAFSGGLEMVAQEFAPPLGPEFLRVMMEVNYGGAVDQALKNLAERIEVDDLKFFTVSVIIQRESGGNLAEILENIAALTRERFKLQGKIRALSAEGKLSGIILVSLPFVVAFALLFINPGYLTILSRDPMGRMLTLVALLMMGTGVYMIRKMIKIRV